MPEYILFVDKGDDQYAKLSTTGTSQEKVADAYYDLPDSKDSDQIEVVAKANIKRFGVTRSVNVIGEAPKRKRKPKAAAEQPVEDGPEPGTEEAREAVEGDPTPENPSVGADPTPAVEATEPELAKEPAKEPKGQRLGDTPAKVKPDDPLENTKEAEEKSPFTTRAKS